MRLLLLSPLCFPGLMFGVTMSSRFSMAMRDFSCVDDDPNSTLPNGREADVPPLVLSADDGGGGGMKIGVIRRLPSDVRASICLSVGPFGYNFTLLVVPVDDEGVGEAA